MFSFIVTNFNLVIYLIIYKSAVLKEWRTELNIGPSNDDLFLITEMLSLFLFFTTFFADDDLNVIKHRVIWSICCGLSFYGGPIISICSDKHSQDTRRYPFHFICFSCLSQLAALRAGLHNRSETEPWKQEVPLTKLACNDSAWALPFPSGPIFIQKPLIVKALFSTAN